MGFATLVRRDAALRATNRPTRAFATTHGMFHRASPCPRVFCNVPCGRWRRRHFFGPRRSDRILQHDTTHGHDLTGYCSSPARVCIPERLRDSSIPRGLVPSRGESCILRELLDEPLRERHPCAFASRERAQDGVLKRRARRSRSFYLSSRKPSPSIGDAEDLSEFQSKRHEPEIVSEGLACSTPHCGGCSMRVPLLANLRTSSCRRSQWCGSWSGRRTNRNQPWKAAAFGRSLRDAVVGNRHRT